MEEDLEGLWRKLQLTEEEDEAVTIPNEILNERADWIPNCLLGSLLTAKSYNSEAFKRTMARIWRGTPLLKVFDVGENLFLFQFKSVEEREVVFNGGPWNFDDNLVLLKALEAGDKPGKELLTKASFWIQIYGLPFAAMTEKMGFFMGQKLGMVREVKVDEQGLGLGRCLAMKVEIDVRKPLRRRMKILVSEGSCVMVDLKYERLPDFCYGCGVMGHKEKECVITLKLRKDNPSFSLQYGKWLRAPPRQRFNSSMWPGSRMGEKSWRKEDSRPLVAETSDSGNSAGKEEAGSRSHTLRDEGESVEPTLVRHGTNPIGVGLEGSPFSSVDGHSAKVVAGKGEVESTQAHGKARDEEICDKPVFSNGLDLGPSESFNEAALRDKLFGDMDIVIKLAHDQKIIPSLALSSQTRKETQTELQQQPLRCRKFTSLKRKGKENEFSPVVKQGSNKRGLDQADELVECKEPVSKKRVLGEIPRNTSVEAVMQPRRQQ